MQQIGREVVWWPSRRKTKGIRRWGGSLEVVGADEAEDGRGARGHIGAARRARWPRWRSNAAATASRGKVDLEKGARPEGERGEGASRGSEWVRGARGVEGTLPLSTEAPTARWVRRGRDLGAHGVG